MNENAAYFNYDPIDLDENANIEPPSKYPQYTGCNRLSSNASSSGYNSMSSYSAPASCDEKRTSIISDKENIDFKGSRSCCSSKGFLKRSQSSLSWMSRYRKSRTSFPKITKLLKCQITATQSMPKSYDLEEMMGECYSAPAVPMMQKEGTINHLEPVGEVRDSGSDKSALSDRADDSLIHNIDHCMITSPPAAAKTPDLKSFATDDQAKYPNIVSSEWQRHHSTPMAYNRYATLSPAPLSPVQKVQPDSKIVSKPLISRCMSVPVPSSEQLEKCLVAMDKNLCSDGRNKHVLPVCDRTSSGLNCISVDTVSDMLQNKYQDKMVKYTIIDCRYPYEYKGGHIKGAINLYSHSDVINEIFNKIPVQNPSGNGVTTAYGIELQKRLKEDKDVSFMIPKVNDLNSSSEEECIDEFSTFSFEPKVGNEEIDELHMDILQASMNHSRSRNPSATQTYEFNSSGSFKSSDSSEIQSLETSDNNMTHVMIFHCEFSSQRAPTLATFLRSIDRTSNYHRYPFLFYPEIYIMKGGYSEFYKKHSLQCRPNNYITMFDKSHKSDLKLYKHLTKAINDSCVKCVRKYNGRHLQDDSKSRLPSTPDLKSTLLTSKPVLRLAQSVNVFNGDAGNIPNVALFEADRLNFNTSGDSSGSEGCRKQYRQLFNDSMDEEKLSTDMNALDLVEEVIRVGRKVEEIHLSTSKAKIENQLFASSVANKLSNVKPMSLLQEKFLSNMQTPKFDFGHENNSTPYAKKESKGFKLFALSGSPMSHGTPVESVFRSFSRRNDS